MIDPESEVQVKPPFDVLYSEEKLKGVNFIVCIGGRGGRKTYEISKWIAWNATINKKRIVVLRDERSLIKQSILSEIWARYNTANVNGVLDNFFIKNETELKDKKTNDVLIYTMGFRASSNEKKTNLKGSSNIDIAVIEEGEDIYDKDKFYTFIDSLRKEGCIVVFIMNTPDINHFVLKQYFNLEMVADGYFKPTPKKIDGFLGIFTDYTCNEYLPKHIIDRYKNYGKPESPLYDLHRYYTATLGYASTGRKGQILKKVNPIKLADYMALPFKEYYGQDFGTSAPAGMVGVKFDKNNCYCREINYMPMSILEIGKLYCKLKLDKKDKIIVDSADPEWRKLRDGFKPQDLKEDDLKIYPQLLKGFYAMPCHKGVDAGITLMESLNLYAVEESINLWDEINKRIYAKDKNGNYTNVPEPGFDHLQDPWIYVVTDQRGWRSSEDITVKSN